MQNLMPHLRKFVIDGCNYEAKIHRKLIPNVDACAIMMPTYMPNVMSKEITRVCIQSIKKHTTEPYQIWVIDNNSPTKYSKWLNEIPYVNVVFDKIEPINPFLTKRYRGFRLFTPSKIGDQFKDVSYANAIGLEIGIRCIDPSSKYVFTMRSDTLVLENNWLSCFESNVKKWAEKGKSVFISITHGSAGFQI